MADVSVKMGVSGIAQFKQGMNEAQASVKTLDAALKANEKQFQKSGDAEAHYAAQTTLLNQKLEQQKQIVANAEKALKQMEANGVRQSSTAYQNMQRTLIEATSAMMDTQDQLDNLGSKASGTAEKTDKLASSLGGLNKKVSLDQVISAVSSITNGMEKAAKKAIDFGQQLWDSIMDSARWADDAATMAQMYNIPIEKYLQMQRLVGNGMDTSVDSMLSAQDKLNRGIGKGSKEVMGYLQELGLLSDAGKEKGSMMLVSDDEVEMFWQAGKAIMAMGEAYDQEAAATALFGRSWKELKPLFDTYEDLEAYNEALKNQTVNSEDTVKNLAELNDAVSKLEQSWGILKNEVLGSLAPALTKGAEAISALLDNLTKYLETEQGKELLDNLGKAVEGLFQGISDINIEDVAKSFSDIFTNIVSGMEWISKNKDTVIGALEGIAVAFGALKLGEWAMNIWKFVDGAKTLIGLGGGGAAGGAAGAAGNATAAGMTVASKLGSFGLLGTMMLAPALIAGGVRKLIPDEYKLESDEFVKAAKYTEDDVRSLREYARVLNEMHQMEDDMFGDNFDQQKYESLATQRDSLAWVTDTELFRKYWLNYVQNQNEKGDLFDLSVLDEMIKEIEDNGGVPVKVDPQAEDGSAESLSEQIGTVSVPVRLEYAGGAGVNMPESHANGIWSVLFDGYSAILHKGERVIPAREVAASRNFSSNLYVESMYMNNGQDADGLAAAMAAAQRRTMSGYGS